MVNVADVAPAATVTVAGTVALAELELMLTTRPPVGAGPFKLSVPVEDVPPVTVAGFTVTLVSVGELIVRVAVLLVAPVLPVIVALSVAATATVVIVNVAEVAPAATVTVAGSEAFAELEVSETTVPPEDAGPFSVIVPVEDVPPVTELGETARLLMVGASIVRVAVLVTLPPVLVMVAVVVVATAVVLTVKVAEVAPAGTVTLAGRVAFVELDDNVMTMPPVGAVPVRVTVPVEVFPPTTSVGLRLTD